MRSFLGRCYFNIWRAVISFHKDSLFGGASGSPGEIALDRCRDGLRFGLEITVCASAAPCRALRPESHGWNESCRLGPRHRVTVLPPLVWQDPAMGNLGRLRRKAKLGTREQGWQVGRAWVLLQLHPCPPPPSQDLWESLSTESPSAERITQGLSGTVTARDFYSSTTPPHRPRGEF